MANNDMINRWLAAILAADVVGYSRMMGADEAGTLAALKHHRETACDVSGSVRHVAGHLHPGVPVHDG